MSPVGGRSEFEVAVTQTGIQAIADSLRLLGRSLGGVEQQAKRTSRAGTELGTSFRNIALRTAAYIGIVRSFRAITGAMRTAVDTGIEYNETIETARLGIASLISAQAELTDANGRHLQGVEKLDGAYQLATDQIRKLRIAGIQTAATTQELVDAFQQATGAGIASGLTLDEIRQVTIRIAQAAGALGVPYRQLNEEIRSLLSGTIDQNTRIAKALGIRNEEVKLMKEQGQLAQFLLDRFEAFGVAGERIVNTWAALRSNVKEAFELLAGEATLPLFEELRGRGLIQLSRIFDFDTAEISDEFAQIIRQLQNVFGGIGNSLAGLIERAVDNAADLNRWLIDNEATINATVEGIGSMISGFGEMIRASNQLVGGVVKWSIEMGVIQQHAETIGDIFRRIARSPGLSALATIAGAAGVLAIIGAVVGPVAAGIATAAAGIVTITSLIDRMSTSTAEAVVNMTRLWETEVELREATADEAQEVLRLTREYIELKQAIADGQVASEDLADANAQMEALLQRLTRISPQYTRAIEEATEANGDLEESVKALLRTRAQDIQGQITLLDLYKQQTEARLTAARAEVEADLARQVRERESNRAFRGENLPAEPFVRGTPSKLTDEIIELERALEAIPAQRARFEESLELIRAALAQGVINVEPVDTGDEEEKLKAQAKVLEEQIARMKNDLKEAEAEIKHRLDTNVINIVQYYDEITDLHVTNLTEQARIFREIAALYDSFDIEKAEGFRTKALEAESQRRIKLWQIEVQRAQASDDLLKDQVNRQAQVLELQGDSVEATRLRMQRDLDAIRDSLLALGELGREEIANAEKIIDLTEWRGTFAELEEVISQGEQRLRARVRDIESRLEFGNISKAQARQELKAAYEEQARILRSIIPLLRTYAELVGDPRLVAAVQQMEAQLAELENQIRSIGNQWVEFGQQVGQIAANNLGEFFANAAIEAENFGDTLKLLGGDMDSLRNLAGALLADIIRLISQMIAAQIIISSFRALSLPPPPGLVGFGAQGGLITGRGIVRAAGGGLLSGPGSGTSDSMLARVSTGEYIVRAAAVDKYGANFLHALNSGALPREIANLRRFASGGLIGTEQPESGKDFRGELTVGLQDGLVLDQLDTPAGERLILKVVSKNRRALLGR